MAPPSGVPPVLAPSVEEAYRRKCIQLKQRMNEIDTDNDAMRLRLTRTEREIQKMRLERAFLLEQLAKRTSTNVEDSEGSPSPPPTPKEKPLRTKRGHRKPSFLANLGDGPPGTTFIQQGPNTLSPSSDAFSHTLPDPVRTSTPQGKRLLPTATNGLAANSTPSSAPTRKPKNAFDLYCSDTRSVLTTNNKKAIADGTFDTEEALARGWRDLNDDEKNEFTKRFDKLKRGSASEKESSAGPAVPRQAVFDGESRGGSAVATVDAEDADEDVQMADDVDETPASTAEGFTAVNRE